MADVNTQSAVVLSAPVLHREKETSSQAVQGPERVKFFFRSRNILLCIPGKQTSRARTITAHTSVAKATDMACYVGPAVYGLVWPSSANFPSQTETFPKQNAFFSAVSVVNKRIEVKRT